MVFNKWEFKEACKRETLDQIDKELNDIADDIYYQSQNLIDKVNSTTDTGFLAGHSRVIKNYLMKTIEYSAPYAACIEFGTRPHFPPVEALVGWVRRKLGVKDDDYKVAYRVALKIAREGTSPQPFLRPPLNAYVAKGVLKYSLVGSDSLAVNMEVGI